MSTTCYNAIRTSGLISLPSERTLRDYTHWIKAGVSFSLSSNSPINVLPPPPIQGNFGPMHVQGFNLALHVHIALHSKDFFYNLF